MSDLSCTINDSFNGAYIASQKAVNQEQNVACQVCNGTMAIDEARNCYICECCKNSIPLAEHGILEE